MGYDTTDTAPAVDYDPFINLDIGAELTTAPTNTSVFIRVPFTIPDQAALDNLVSLTLRMKYEDGFVAYLNGQEIARPGAGGTAGTPRPWNASASFARNETQAIAFADIPITVGSAPQLLRVGTNILAIHGMTRASTGAPDGDALFVPQLIATLADVSPTAAGLHGHEHSAPGKHRRHGPCPTRDGLERRERYAVHGRDANPRQRAQLSPGDANDGRNRRRLHER